MRPGGGLAKLKRLRIDYDDAVCEASSGRFTGFFHPLSLEVVEAFRAVDEEDLVRGWDCPEGSSITSTKLTYCC